MSCRPLLLLLLLATLVSAQRRRTKLPIVGEDAKNRISASTTQCSFGNETFEIDDKWRPNLGSHVGVLLCVHCECVGANRKSRLVARVKCRNIKNDCPKPACEDAVALPDRCCKTCPGQQDAVVEAELSGRKITRKEEEGRQIYSLVGKRPAAGTHAPVVAKHVDTKNVMDDQENNDVASSHKCYYEGNIFDDGSQWKAQHQECQMCSCQVGVAECKLEPLSD